MTLRHRAPSLARLAGLFGGLALLISGCGSGDQAPRGKVVAPASPHTVAAPADPTAEAPAPKLAEAGAAAPAGPTAKPAPKPVERAPGPPPAATVNKLAPVARQAPPKRVVDAKPAEPDVPFDGKRIDVIHTANLIGEIEPCG